MSGWGRTSLRRLHDYFWGFKLTSGGRVLVVAVLVAAIGSVTVEIPVYQVFCVLLAVLMVAEPMGLLFRPVVELHGGFPELARAGSPFTTEITVTNRSRRPVFDLTLGLFGLPPEIQHHQPERFVPVLWTGESEVIPITLEARRRGFYRLPAVHAHSTFPFNLMRFGGCRLPERSVTVLPVYHPLEHLDLPVTQRYQPGGILFTTGVGETGEYAGNREYMPGEPMRHLDVRAWARLGKPIVREFQEEYSCRVAVILDTYVPRGRKAGPEGFADLEAAISLTSAVADSLSEGDYLIDVFAAGPDLHVFRTGRSRANLERILEILACVDASRSNPMGDLSAAVLEELETISTAICVMLDWTATHQQLADRILEAGCALKVILIRDEPSTCFMPGGEFEFLQCSPEEVRNGEVRWL